jgi:hypothetical protein
VSCRPSGSRSLVRSNHRGSQAAPHATVHADLLYRSDPVPLPHGAGARPRRAGSRIRLNGKGVLSSIPSLSSFLAHARESEVKVRPARLSATPARGIPKTPTGFALFGRSSSRAVRISSLHRAGRREGGARLCASGAVGLGRVLPRRRLCLRSGLPGSDARGASRRRQDAAVPIFPADADARGIFLEHLLDHSCPARLRNLFGLNDDPVSGVRPHLSLILLFRFARALGEASAPFPPVRSSAEGGPPGGGDSRASAIWKLMLRDHPVSPRSRAEEDQCWGIGKGRLSLAGEFDGMPVGRGRALGRLSV